MSGARSRDGLWFWPLAHAALVAGDPELAFVPDAQIDAGAGSLGLVRAVGAAVPGRVTCADQAVAHGPAHGPAHGSRRPARAVRSDGSLLDVSVQLVGHTTAPHDAAARADARHATCPFPAAVFVYGTLMQGEEREAALRDGLPGVVPTQAVVSGQLVHLGAWPGLVTGSARVTGELFDVPCAADLASILRQLDTIEDFEGYERAPTDYVRAVLPVTTTMGVRWAWGYRYVGALERAVPIPSGRWRDAPRTLPGWPAP